MKRRSVLSAMAAAAAAVALPTLAANPLPPHLLATKPNAVGLAVPGMPVGSPGMEMGARKDPYQVLLVDRSGRETAFANYPKL